MDRLDERKHHQDRDQDGPRRERMRVGCIIALASQLQARKRNAPAGSRGLARQELQALAAPFGIEPNCLEKAMEMAERESRRIVLACEVPAVRKRILAPFPKVKLTPPRNRMVSIRPRLLVDGDNGLEIQWGDRRHGAAEPPRARHQRPGGLASTYSCYANR